MHQLNKTLMAENQLLRNKLKDNERLNADLKDEVDRYTQMQRASAQAQTSQPGTSNDDLLALYMAEMRELRLRLEASIRTNDALQAQLEKQLAQGENGEGSPPHLPDKLIIIRENETLRTEVLKRDVVNKQLRETIDRLNYEKAK